MKKTLMSIMLAMLIAVFAASCGRDESNESGGTNTINNADSNVATADIATDDASTPVIADGDDTFDGSQNSMEVNANAASGYVCRFDNGSSIEMGSNAAEVIDALGNYSDYMEAPSCINDGYDKVYTYSGFTVTTSPDSSGREYVAEINIISDAVAFADGNITIGSSVSDVEAQFGADYTEQFGVRKYDMSSSVISFSIDGGIVTGINVSYSAS